MLLKTQFSQLQRLQAAKNLLYRIQYFKKITLLLTLKVSKSPMV